jgi:hypothetical protein
LFGVFFEAQPAIAREAIEGHGDHGFGCKFCDTAHPASPSHSSYFVEHPVTTLGLTGIQETWLTISLLLAVVSPHAAAVEHALRRAP